MRFEVGSQISEMRLVFGLPTSYFDLREDAGKVGWEASFTNLEQCCLSF